MFNISEIRELIKLLDSTNISELEIKNEGAKISIKKNYPANVATARSVEVIAPPVETNITSVAVNTAATVAPVQEQQTNIIEIKSPMVGTFYSSPAPDAQSYVKVGDRVGEKDVVCIIEAMKLMNEIEAECKGSIIEICVENGQLVEYGQTLYKVSKE
jgi:acetyl-CoA carboxylase biotin carboxyl carrier protein